MKYPQKSKKVLALAGLFFIMILLPAASKAGDYSIYVSGSYKGESDGSKSKPFGTIKEAVEAAADLLDGARTIFVKKGIYAEDLFVDKSMEISGETKGSVVIQGGIEAEKDLKLENLTLSGRYDGITVSGKAGLTLENCEIKDFKSKGVDALPGEGKVVVHATSIHGGTGKGMYIEAGRKIEISDSHIFNNGEEGLDIRAKVSGTIKNNVIERNGESGIELIVGDSAIVIEGNKIQRNAASAIASQFYKQTSSEGEITILNNSLLNNGKYGLDCARPSGGKPSLTYWIDSINLSQNDIGGNGIKPIKDFCDIIDAVDEEEAESENQITAAESEETETENESDVDKEAIGNEKEPGEEESSGGPKTDQEIREASRGEEELEQEENFWEEAQAVQTAQREAELRLNERLIKIRSRGAIMTFFFGPDYLSLNLVRGEVRNMRENALKLSGFLEQSEVEENRAALEELADKIERTANETSEFLGEEEGKFSLFGWLICSVM